MLNGIRKVTQHGVGRVVMTFLLGLLIVAFAAWGIGDMFRGFTSDKVAQVGSTAITGREFQNEFQTLVYRYQRMYKIPLTNAQARAQGLDMQVLARLIDEAALNQRARSMGLGLSDAAIAEAVRSDPQLQDASGQFNRDLFNSALRDSGLSEAGFFAKQRGMYLRQQMQYALADGLLAPKPLVAALVGEESAKPRHRLFYRCRRAPRATSRRLPPRRSRPSSTSASRAIAPRSIAPPTSCSSARRRSPSPTR